MSPFVHRLFVYRPHKPRHPLLRVLTGLLGLVVLALLLVFGLFIGLGMLLFSAVRHLSRPRPARPQASPEMVIEGEYSVVRQPQHMLHPH